VCDVKPRLIFARQQLISSTPPEHTRSKRNKRWNPTETTSLDNDRAVHLSTSFPHKHIFTHLYITMGMETVKTVWNDYRRGAYCWTKCLTKYTALGEACQSVIQENFCLKKDERR